MRKVITTSLNSNVLINTWNPLIYFLGGEWTPHRVELAVWTYYNANDLKPEILEEIENAKKNGEVEKTEENGKEQHGEPDLAPNDSNPAFSKGGEDSNLSADDDSNNLPSAVSSEENSNSHSDPHVSSNGNDNGNGTAHGHEEETAEKENSSTPAPAPAPANGSSVQNGNTESAANNESPDQQQQTTTPVVEKVDEEIKKANLISSSEPIETSPMKREREEEDVTDQDPSAKKIKTAEEDNGKPEIATA